jgi:hypothetical protein
VQLLVEETFAELWLLRFIALNTPFDKEERERLWQEEEAKRALDLEAVEAKEKRDREYEEERERQVG